MSGARFEVGQRVYARSIGDHNCVWIFTVTARTPRFVTLFQEDTGRPLSASVRVGIKVDHDGEEYALPFGEYSMRPSVRPSRQVGWPAPDPADRQMKGWLVRALERAS
jgi:hypothetical protein